MVIAASGPLHLHLPAQQPALTDVPFAWPRYAAGRSSADNATQRTLGAWVTSVENAIEAAGVPVPIRRAQQAPFHSTLCTFSSEYSNSSAIAMAAVNERFGAR